MNFIRINGSMPIDPDKCYLIPGSANCIKIHKGEIQFGSLPQKRYLEARISNDKCVITQKSRFFWFPENSKGIKLPEYQYYQGQHLYGNPVWIS